MISDGLYVSLIGLAIVFLVLIVLFIAITLLNLIENKKIVTFKVSQVPFFVWRRNQTAKQKTL